MFGRGDTWAVNFTYRTGQRSILRRFASCFTLSEKSLCNRASIIPKSTRAATFFRMTRVIRVIRKTTRRTLDFAGKR